jgi:hypothetical protein
VTQVVKLRLEPSTAQVEPLRGYRGTARAAYNILLHRVRANLGQPLPGVSDARGHIDAPSSCVGPARTWRWPRASSH